MARHPDSWRPRDETAHAVIQHAIDQGYVDSGRPFYIPDMPGHATARRAQQSILRGLGHFGLGRAAWVTDQGKNQCWQDCADPEAPHGVGFELHSKHQARRHVVTSTGGSAANLKYNPYQRRQNRPV